MAQITYANKSFINENPDVAAQYKVSASDMNEIKNVVNNNDNLMGDVSTLSTASTDVVSSINAISKYSTTEQRIGTWTNGKPLYGKVITGTKVSGTELSITVDNNLDEIVMVYGGRLIRTDLNRGYAIPMYESSNVYVRVELRQDTKQIGIVSSTGQYSNGNVSIVVCYTKTTD